MSAFVSGWTFGSGWLGNQVDRYEACAAFVEDKFACCQSSSGPAAFNETLLGQEGSPSSSNTTLSSSADDGFWQFFLGIMAVLAASILSPLATWFMSLSHDRRVLQGTHSFTFQPLFLSRTQTHTLTESASSPSWKPKLFSRRDLVWIYRRENDGAHGWHDGVAQRATREPQAVVTAHSLPLPRSLLQPLLPHRRNLYRLCQ